MTSYLVLFNTQKIMLCGHSLLDLLAGIICFMLEIFLFGTRNLSKLDFVNNSLVVFNELIGIKLPHACKGKRKRLLKNFNSN